MSGFFYFNSKISFLIPIFLSLILKGCECISVSSKESLDAQEKKPWSYDESSVAGAAHKSYKKITPHIGWNVPLDEPSKIAILIKKNVVIEEVKPEVKTTVNKKTKSIEVVSPRK